MNVLVTCTCTPASRRPPCGFVSLPCITTGANYFFCRSPFGKPTLAGLVRVCGLRLPVPPRCYAEQASDTHTHERHGEALVGSINAGWLTLSFLSHQSHAKVSVVYHSPLQRSKLNHHDENPGLWAGLREGRVKEGVFVLVFLSFIGFN